MIRLNADTGRGFDGAPTMTSVPSRFSKARYWIQIVLRRNCVENEVEASGMLEHVVGIVRNHDFVGPEPKPVGGFVREMW